MGQIALNCDVFKTYFVRPTEIDPRWPATTPSVRQQTEWGGGNHGSTRETLARCHDMPAWGGHGRTWLAVLSHTGTLGACDKTTLQLRRLCVQRGKWFGTDQDGAQPGARIQSGPTSHAAKGGAPPPPTIMAIATALPRLLMAAAARPQSHACHSTSSSSITTEVTARAHIARARLGPVLRRCPEIPPEHMQGGSRCPGRPAVEPERARWHDPVLGRWLGLTPEQPALCLRGFPRRLRVALSRVSDPPGLGRR